MLFFLIFISLFSIGKIINNLYADGNGIIIEQEEKHLNF